MTEISTDPDVDIAEFATLRPSWIAAHPGRCCLEAATAVRRTVSYGTSLIDVLSSLPLLVEWTPTAWPAHWCDLIADNRIRGDCGAFAAIASQLMMDAGLAHVRSGAAIRPAKEQLAHWAAQWQNSGASSAWIGRELVYHEVLQVGTRWWDPLQACFIDGEGAETQSGHVVWVSPQQAVHLRPTRGG